MLKTTAQHTGRYASRIDLGAVLLIWGLCLFLSYLGWRNLSEPGYITQTGPGEPMEPRSLFFLILFVSGVLLSWLHGVSYQIRTGRLILRCGLVRWSYPLRDIERVFGPGMQSSGGVNLGWSSRTILVELKSGRIRQWKISPKDPKAFMDHLVRITPALAWDGEMVVAIPKNMSKRSLDSA
ncbi:MAG: hypothetical protein GY862_17280 [Gammaproteobacteria bacterium]|nr:hypothetical protein [Gammaproteobacteria bacterium]